MVIIVIRAAILYGVLLFSMRIMGKGELGELQPFDLVVSLMLAELAVMPLADLNAPLLHGLIATATIMFLQSLMSYIALKSNTARKFLCGRPSVLVEHGKFNIKEMNKLRINVNDILGQMRLKGFCSFEEIDFLIMETNGEMSIIAPAAEAGKTCTRLPVAVILDGKIMKDNFKKYHIDKESFQKSLQDSNLNIKEILYGFVDENEKFTFYKR